MTRLLPLLLALVATTPLARAEGKRAVGVGEVVPDFSGKDVDGVEFRLSTARAPTRATALEEVLRVAKARGATTPKAEDAVDAVPERKGSEAERSRAQRRTAFLREAGRPWGRLPDAASVESAKTLDDVAAWIERGSAAPIVFLIWSPKCPFVKGYDAKVQAAVAETGARLYAVSSNVPVTDDDVRAYVKEHSTPYRVLVDRKQEVCDLLGGKNTPHAIVLDGKNVLRYRGGIDDDPLEAKPEAERKHWLRDALLAIQGGKEVQPAETPATGCVVRRQ